MNNHLIISLEKNFLNEIENKDVTSHKKIIKLVVKLVFFSFLLFVIVISYIIIQYYVEKFEKYELNPVLGDNLTGSLFDPCVIQDKNGSYRMYVSWRNFGSIALSSSKDGINWSNLSIALDKGKPNSWQNIVNRACVIYKDGIYHMWYTGQNNDMSKIGYSKSKDGYNFTRLEEPILVPEYKYEKQSVMNPYVIFDEEEKIYKMWYAAGETYEPDVIAYATSNDGLNWKKYDKNPIFTPNHQFFSFDSFKVGACDMHKLKDNTYFMFYIGYSDLDTARIFVAKSKNGINKWKRSNPIIGPSKNKFDSNACYKPSAIYNSKINRWMVWYNGRTDGKEYIGLAMNVSSFIK